MFKDKQQAKNNLIVISTLGLILICLSIGAFYAGIFYSTNQQTPVDLPEVPSFVLPTALPTSVQITPQPNVTLVSPSPTATLPSSFFSFQFPSGSQATSTLSSSFNTAVPTSTIQSITFASATPVTVIPQPSPTTPSSNVMNCYNILYPAKAGQEWTYAVTAKDRSGDVRMRVVSIEGSRGIVDVFNSSRGASGRGFMECQQDIILNFPALTAEVLLGNALDGNANVQFVSGVLAPNETAFRNTNWALSWSSNYLVSGSGQVNFRENDFDLVLNSSPITMTCQTLASGEAAFETVTVPAGTFKALKVICTGQGQGTGTVNGTPITGLIRAQSTQWFTPYLGLVKLQSDFASIDVFGITIPLDTSNITSRIELKGFIQVP